MVEFFYSALLIFIVVMLFNFIIFWHELGHFLAARWRGVKVDRFQVWFGKPIWKKTINGVQYGLGWLPFGGFVALPQMAPMEAIEGGNRDAEPLPKIKPIDKIIVAFAGPFFSLLLAVMAAVLVWFVGKPRDVIETTVIGGVAKDSPAEKAGLQAGDKILEVNGEEVVLFRGDFEAISERIMLTEKEQITFKIERADEVMEIKTQFEIAETVWYKRRALPSVGIAAAGVAKIGYLIPSENQSPADRAGLQLGDIVTEVDGVKVIGPQHVSNLLSQKNYESVVFTIKRADETLKVTVQPLIPLEPDDVNLQRPMLGIGWDTSDRVSTELIYPDPISQIKDTAKAMWFTLKAVSSPKSKVGLDQLAGPAGIARTKFLLLQTPNGWLRVLYFFVFFNINLAILNMLPLPVLDGGHITLAVGEILRGKPPEGRILEFVQTFFVLMLLTFMLFITTKDIGDMVNPDAGEPAKFRWPESTK